MNQKQFLKELEKKHMECVGISKRKNADYAEENDPFLNFRGCEAFGVPAEVGLVVRMSDKLIRSANLLKREAKVKDESLEDTLLDLSNYAIILAMYLEDKRKNENT